MKISTLKNHRLCDFYVASSYNTSLSGTQIIDYATTDMIKKVIQTGARFLEFQVFGDQYGPDAIPVVSSGFKQGEWKLTLNTLYLEDVIKTIKDHAFRIYDGTDGCPNNLDPLIISLDLKTNYNYFVNNRIQKLFTTYLLDYLLDPTYNYQAKNLAIVPLKNLMGKIILISSDGFQGSSLEEIINYSWAFPKLKRFHYSDLENVVYQQTTTSSNVFSIDSSVQKTEKNIDNTQLKVFNNSGMSIVVPHNEGDILTSNYDPETAWNMGCQFVAINYQSMDKDMDKYINKFRNKAFVLKPQQLRQ